MPMRPVTQILTLLLSVSLLISCASRPSFAASEAEATTQPLLVNIKRLSLESALRIAQAALKECRKAGVQVSITVLDRSGDEQVVLRDVLASNITLEISKKKAYTAIVFNQPSSAMHKQFPDYSIPKIDRILIEGGGMPINAGGKILGGVGVSGAPSPKQDEACAKAGVEAIQDDLEMSAGE